MCEISRKKRQEYEGLLSLQEVEGTLQMGCDEFLLIWTIINGQHLHSFEKNYSTWGHYKVVMLWLDKLHENVIGCFVGGKYHLFLFVGGGKYHRLVTCRF